jgi:hypothetical protein
MFFPTGENAFEGRLFLRTLCALSASFQKSGWAVTWFSSATRFCLASTSKPPPQ